VNKEKKKMLMINEQHGEDRIAFRLAGTLAGDWAIEFERCWRNATGSTNASRIIVDLTEVTFVDESGKGLLGLMMKEGAELIAADILMRSIVEEIANESSTA
jgi:anti-anti-sigma regulatory factor